MKSESIFKNPALVGYLVKRAGEEYPGKQIGKTIIQQMMYLLARRNEVNFDHSMHHYGPYSAQVSYELNFAENSDIVQIKWVNDKGYFIKTTPKLKNFASLIADGEKHAIDDIVKKFGEFNAIDLSIITTAFFLKDNFGVHETKLAGVVHQVKQSHSLQYIENVLNKSGVL